ncbi:unnamed protein product [Phytophthora fragariaefolia]|uniref:Unnamed protein product n=1 Tax=Phytophthora fragariaefolia TaxID=1490495 RepID=A0A9W7DA67_9STRA|nr:unnamed protein product [Phytophthora fragariaefolia]
MQQTDPDDRSNAYGAREAPPVQAVRKPSFKEGGSEAIVTGDPEGYPSWGRCKSAIWLRCSIQVSLHFTLPYTGNPGYRDPGHQTLITAMFTLTLKPGVTKAFQEQLAIWIYNTGMAFYKIEHRSLLDALQLLTSGIEVAMRCQLSAVLLDRAYIKSLKLLEMSLHDKIVTVSSDGWTDICGHAVLNYMAVCGDRAYCLETVYTDAQANDAVVLAAGMQRAIEKYHFLNVGAVITGNTRAN